MTGKSIPAFSFPQIGLGLFLLIGVLSLAVMPMDALAQVNKCTIKGKIVYTNQACPDKNASSGKVNSSWFRDYRGYKKALKLSRQKNRPIFIYGYTDWCVYCKQLHAKIFDDPNVQKALSRYIKVKINPEHSATDARLFSKWGGRGYPTLFIQSNSKSSPKRTRNPFTRRNGKWVLMQKRNFISMLDLGLL